MNFLKLTLFATFILFNNAALSSTTNSDAPSETTSSPMTFEEPLEEKKITSLCTMEKVDEQNSHTIRYTYSQNEIKDFNHLINEMYLAAALEGDIHQMQLLLHGESPQITFKVGKETYTAILGFNLPLPSNETIARALEIQNKKG